MRLKRLAIGILLIAAVGYSHAITLKECIHIGLTNNLSLANAHIGISKGQATVSQNRARLLPMINGVFQYTDYLKQPVNVTTGTVLGNDFPDDPTWQVIRSMQHNVNVGVQLNLPLYNRGIYTAIDVAKVIERLSRLSYEKAVEDLTVQIGNVYYLAQSFREQVHLTDENISRMQALCTITEAMYEEGVVLEIDLDRARINLRNLMATRNQFDMVYEQQINMLRFLLDYSPETPLDVDRMEEGVELFESAGISSDLTVLRQSEMQKELIERKIRAVNAGYLPSISLTGYAGGLSYQEKFSHFFHTAASSKNWFGNCFVGVNVSIPIFDANSKRLQIRQHRYDAEQAEIHAEQLRNSITRDYSNALLQINHNVEVYRTQLQSYRLAQEVYGVTEEQYREGISSMTAILQDEMQLRTAQSACVQAHCQYNIARLDLLRLTGKLSLLTE